MGCSLDFFNIFMTLNFMKNNFKQFYASHKMILNTLLYSRRNIHKMFTDFNQDKNTC